MQYIKTVNLKRLEHKEHIMGNLRNVKATPIEKFRGIVLSHDLYSQGRDENKKKVEEMKKQEARHQVGLGETRAA